MKRVFIVQSNYIPWKGYFDAINLSDEFVIYDDVQYTRRDWRNRNKIKTSNGLLWLTIPVIVRGKYYQKISDTKIADKEWARRHWETIVNFYSRAAYFKEYRLLFEQLYLDCREEYLSRINYRFISAINNILGIKTKISWSSDYNLVEGKSERLLEICRQLKATEYLSGPSAKDYLDEALFLKENIKVSWMDYSGYPEYKQLFPPFEHSVSIIDLIFNEGQNAKKYMKSFQ